MNCFYRILVVGESWHGSDCTGLARGFRQLGHAVDLIGSDQFLPKLGVSLSSKIIRRSILPSCIVQFNNFILEQLEVVQPDIVVIFKGNHVKGKTLKSIRERGIWLCNFYPDISFFSDKIVSKDTWQQYNHIFTTKLHGPQEMKDHLGLETVTSIQHGYDNLVHRKFDKGTISEAFCCDVSFIGGWTHKKERYLKDVVSSFPESNIKIWGSRWESSLAKELMDFIQGSPVLGDFYALAISGTKINLGLLQNLDGFAYGSDQVTSRTFHIPASGGFLLHERTKEVLEYFEEGREIECFESKQELVEKVRYYLDHDVERLCIAEAGYERCLKENSLSARAQIIIDKYLSDVGT